MAKKAGSYVALCLAILWLSLGLLGWVVPPGDSVALILIPPAVPLYLLSSTFRGTGVSHGLLWTSAHGPPFLTPGGIAVVYIVPGLVFLSWAARRIRRGRQAREQR